MLIATPPEFRDILLSIARTAGHRTRNSKTAEP